MNKEPIRHSTPATIEPSVWRAGVKLPRYPYRYVTGFSILGQTMAGLIAVGVLCLGLSFDPTLSFAEAMALALIGTALILLPLGDRANTRIAPLSIYALNPHATQRVPCVVILTVDGFELWRDMGVVGFDDVRLVYAGLRTSFSLRPENLFGSDPSGSIIKGFRRIRLRQPGESKVLIEFRPFERFGEGDSENRRDLCHHLVRVARDNAVSGPAATGSTQWPLLTMSRSETEVASKKSFLLEILSILPPFIAATYFNRWEIYLLAGWCAFIGLSRFLDRSRHFRQFLKAREEADEPASLPGKV
ncbi:MAG: hypothetical protein K1X67_01050 [Fimbriimonadaceae bacterium]|nr:hypothetical protein [Fimbriimonadaceae bacterium]